MISLLMNSVPLSVNSISGGPNLAIQCSKVLYVRNKHFNVVLD